MQNLDLTASRWASPQVKRERESHTPRSTSPQRQQESIIKSGRAGHFGSTASRPLLPDDLALSAAQRQYKSRQTELQRFRRVFRRLAWKANSLTHWSHRALSLAQEYQAGRQGQYGHSLPEHDTVPRAALGRYAMLIDPIEAERQFKIDFYEFYALLERGLVCLLGVWGIVITASAAFNVGTRDDEDYAAAAPSRATSNSIIGDSRAFHGSPHMFHANVLAALDHPSNPLHDVVGSGEARGYIGVAKEFRNKWKDVEQRPDDSFRGRERAEEEWDPAKTKRYEKVLQDLRLEELLGTVLAALEECGRRAEVELQRLEAQLSGSGGVSSTKAGFDRELMDLDMEDAPFEYVSGPHDFGNEMEF